MKYRLIKPINPTLSTMQQILTNRNIPLKDIFKYLNTTDDVVSSPLAFGKELMKEAATTLISHIQYNEPILIVVDSDVDGFTSAAILINFLHDLFPSWVESKLRYVLHSGKQHGLKDHIENILYSNIYKLIITPDSGTNDVEECKKLFNHNTTVLILDHHLQQEENPYAILINNQIQNYPNKQLSGAGVTWQFCRYLSSLMNRKEIAEKYIDLVALGLNLYRG